MTKTEPSGATEEPTVVTMGRRGHVLVITINRPEARNSVNKEVADALGDAMELAESDRAVRVVVLTGAGDQAFCAGADLKAIARGEGIMPEGDRAHWGFAGYASHPISKPTIAAVNGFALGGGTELALASDLVVAADTAMFGLPEVRRGLVAAAGGVFRLPQQISRKIALEVMFTGESISADRAYDLGLVNRVVPAGQVLDTAIELANSIAENAPLAVQASKRIACGIGDGRVHRDDEDWTRNRSEARAVMESEDAKEGPRAFAEKRAPKWAGK